jgi:L-ascorbate metabolism protein UlaG (beta-lactamase superfamily)
MKITYYGHAAIGVAFGGKYLLFDPFVTGNPIAQHIDIYILISHGHGDHVQDMEAIARRTHASVISNAEIVGWAEKKGIKGHPMHRRQFHDGFPGSADGQRLRKVRPRIGHALRLLRLY